MQLDIPFTAFSLQLFRCLSVSFSFSISISLCSCLWLIHNILSKACLCKHYRTTNTLLCHTPQQYQNVRHVGIHTTQYNMPLNLTNMPKMSYFGDDLMCLKFNRNKRYSPFPVKPTVHNLMAMHFIYIMAMLLTY